MTALILLQAFNNITQGPGTDSIQTYTLEIATMLVGAFALGYLLRYFWKGSPSPKTPILNEITLDKKPVPESRSTQGNSLEISRLKSDLAESNALVASLRAKPDNSATLESLNKELNLKITEVVSLKTEIINLRGELDACMVARAAFTGLPAKSPSQKDELKRLEGIGPKIQSLLYEAGINTFKQLSETSIEKIKEILLSAGERYRIHDPSSWPQQAALAADGKWEELKELQKNLLSGKG